MKHNRVVINPNAYGLSSTKMPPYQSVIVSFKPTFILSDAITAAVKFDEGDQSNSESMLH